MWVFGRAFKGQNFEGGTLRARGYLFHVSPYEVAGQERRGEERVRLISMAAGDIIYVLPKEVDVSKLQLKRSPKSMMLTDGKMAMDLSDFMLRG
jgi:hypothetical protein